MYALPIPELATVELSAAAGAIGQSFRTCFGTDIQRILKTTLPAGVAAHHGTFQISLQLVQPSLPRSGRPYRALYAPAESLAEPRGSTEKVRMEGRQYVVAKRFFQSRLHAGFAPMPIASNGVKSDCNVGHPSAN